VTAVQVIALVLLVPGALMVVLAHDTVRLVVVSGIYSLLLVALFVAFQAPDVALSELVVGTVALPAALIVAVSRERRGR
jgi:uncharacterized MnhB-related membrane protein